MSDDLYHSLGLKQGASDDDIKKAYRKIVRTSHPDINPDDTGAEARFKAAAAAYDLLKDPEKRRRYDAGEIDASGQEKAPRNYYRSYSGGPEGQGGFGGAYTGGAGAGMGAGGRGADFSDVFDELFRRQRAQDGQGFAARGQDMAYTMEVDFLDAARGAVQEIALPTGDRLSVKIPEGTADGQTVRLRGKGAEGFGGGPRGDALVTVTVRPHPVFRREGDDIVSVLPLTLYEAALGAKVEAQTISGPVNLTVPKGASSGQMLRLKGRGVKGGDQRVELRIVMPSGVDADLVAMMETWRDRHPYDPRKESGR